MSMSLNRRKFLTTSMVVTASTAATMSSAFALTTIAGGPSDHAIVGILKKRLPALTLDDSSLQAYVGDVMQRLRACQNKNGQAFAGIFKQQPSSIQFEHFFVQDFIANSNVFSAVPQGQLVAFTPKVA
jgi:hypothetical protein